MPSNLNKIDINVLVNELARNNENIYENCSEVDMQSCGIIDTIGNSLCVRDIRQCPSIYIDKSALSYYEYINKETYHEINNITYIIIKFSFL